MRPWWFPTMRQGRSVRMVPSWRNVVPPELRILTILDAVPWKKSEPSSCRRAGRIHDSGTT